MALQRGDKNVNDPSWTENSPAPMPFQINDDRADNRVMVPHKDRGGGRLDIKEAAMILLG
jgi:hypothetical protein